MSSIAQDPVLENSPVDLPTLLASVPAFVRPWLTALLAPLAALLGAAVYRTVLARNARHPLLRLAAAYDPATVVAAAAAFRHPTGPGAPPTYSLATLVRAEIVRLWAGSCSDPALEGLLAADLVARWFCHLPLLGPTPDHATLNRFHLWAASHMPATLFEDVLAFLDRVDPEDPVATPQIVDTFALHSPAAPVGAATILLVLARHLVATWRAQAPPALQPLLTALDLTPLTTKYPLYTPELRLVALRAAATTATALLAALTPALPTLPAATRQAVQPLLDLLTKVLEDETRTDAAGLVTERPAGSKGPFRLGSPHDPEATFRKHGPDDCQFGYNAIISTTATRIRAAVLLTGCTSDSAAPVAVLKAHKAAGRPLPAHLVMDQAGGHGKTRAEVATVSAGQTQITARVPPAGGADPTRFGPADFPVSADGLTCTCPQGVTSTARTPRNDGDGESFRFTYTQCADCPLRDRCRAPDSAPKSYRTVYISHYTEHTKAAQVFNATVDGKALLGERWRVEPTVAWLVRYDGARRARRVGTAAAAFHLAQACAGRNLWRWLARRARAAVPPQPPKGVVCP